MYALIYQFDVLPEHREEFRAQALRHAADCLREEPGTRQYQFIQDETNPDRFYEFAAYTDPAAFEAHLRGPVVQRAISAGGQLLSGPIVPLVRGFIVDSR
jgi:quinol monooxygenase YgiN